MENEQVEQVETMNKKPSKSGPSLDGVPMCQARFRKDLCNLLTAELLIDFWFGIGVVLAVKTVQSIESCIEELISR